VNTGEQKELKDASLSAANDFEVAICHDLARLVKAQEKSTSIAVISMYRNQVEKLTDRLKGLVDRDDIQSVDAFEGQERDVVILSLVRSNEPGTIGFLNDRKRVNVAISRAKKLLVIVGDASTVIKGGPTLFGPIFERIDTRGLVVGPGAIVKACGVARIRSSAMQHGKTSNNRTRGRRGTGARRSSPVTGRTRR
jgi:hypothetical protein